MLRPDSGTPPKTVTKAGMCNLGVNADSIDIFIDLVQANIPYTLINLKFIFNQIYQNNLPPPIKHYFTDVYLFCLHKDPLDKSKL